MKLRAWLERGVIIIAALATIATSRKGWVVEAPKVSDDPNAARIYVVEATHKPHLEMYTNSSYESPKALDGEPTWPGKARYLIPSGATIGRVYISEKCSGGGGACSKCEAPTDAKVRIESVTPVQTWTLEATKSPDVQPTNMNPDVWTTFRVIVDASHLVRLRVQSTGPEGRVSHYNGEHHVDFGTVQMPTSFTWTVTAKIEQACPDVTKPCTPPADARLSIG